MSEDASSLPWTAQQWASLRAVVQESARKSRVASTFLPLSGPLGGDQSTTAANWMNVQPLGYPQRGEAGQRLEVRSGKTLHLTTIACNVYLRGSEVADPDLDAAKSMVRRAAEVLARLEDAIIFNGVPSEEESAYPAHVDGTPIVQPLIYTISGGRDLIGLRQAPLTQLISMVEAGARDNGRAAHLLNDLLTARCELRLAGRNSGSSRSDASEKLRNAEQQLIATFPQHFMSVPIADDAGQSPIVEAVVKAVETIESHGHFGPFAAVFGHKLFEAATRPARSSLVLPTDRFVPFLDGGPLHRSSTLPPEEGLLIALGGRPIELVLGCDMDVQFVQVTLEPRYVLRVYERFVLRIKELDAVCRLALTPAGAGGS